MNLGERKLCEFKNGLSGSFYQNLFTTIFCADVSNRYRLAEGFPEEVEAVRRYNNETGYWQNLEKEFKEGFKNENKEKTTDQE